MRKFSLQIMGRNNFCVLKLMRGSITALTNSFRIFSTSHAHENTPYMLKLIVLSTIALLHFFQTTCIRNNRELLRLLPICFSHRLIFKIISNFMICSLYYEAECIFSKFYKIRRIFLSWKNTINMMCKLQQFMQFFSAVVLLIMKKKVKCTDKSATKTNYTIFSGK